MDIEDYGDMDLHEVVEEVEEEDIHLEDTHQEDTIVDLSKEEVSIEGASMDLAGKEVVHNQEVVVVEEVRNDAFPDALKGNLEVVVINPSCFYTLYLLWLNQNYCLCFFFSHLLNFETFVCKLYKQCMESSRALL